jgi:tol-pal system protein YbgF
MKYILFASFVLFSFQSTSQDYNPNYLEGQRLDDRLSQIEKNLNMLQRQFYRDGNVPAPAQMDDYASPNSQVRIAELEEQIRDLTGKIEQNQFVINNALNEIKKLSQDIDFRLSEMKKKQINRAITANINNDRASNKTDNEPELIGKLEKTNGESLAPIDEDNKYDIAFKYLRNAEYEKAESALKDFIVNNKDSSLISNAYYWLGETFYVREDFEKSAVNFLKGYQKLPKGNKAADNLLKLAMSLNMLEKSKEACTTFSKLEKEFPDAEKSIKDKVASEKKAIKCS